MKHLVTRQAHACQRNMRSGTDGEAAGVTSGAFIDRWRVKAGYAS